MIPYLILPAIRLEAYADRIPDITVEVRVTLWQRFLMWQRGRRYALAVWLVERLYGDNMMWDVDDSEQPFYDIREWAEDRWDMAKPGMTTLLKVQRALSLPNRTYRVKCEQAWGTDEGEVEFTYELEK